MKKLLIILTLTLSVTCPSLAKNPEINRSGDTTTIVADGDTVKITDEGVKEAISQAINDTVWDGNDATVENYYREQEQNAQAVPMRWADVAQNATIILSVSVIVVVFLCLLFYYLHRKAKYRVIEKAIENNYPLPPSLGGAQPPKVVPTSADAWRGVGTRPTQAASHRQPHMPSTDSASMPPQQPIFYRTNYRAYKSSFTLISVGVALALFFLFADAIPMVWLMLLISVLGLGKGLIIYKEQQQELAYWKWQMQQQTSAPQQAQQQEQPEHKNADPQPPTFRQSNNAGDPQA